jgi:hypothetical protein
VVQSDPPTGLCIACAPIRAYAKHTCLRHDKWQGPLGEKKFYAYVGRHFLRMRGAKGELVVLAHDNETLIDIAEVLSLDRNALLDLNRDYIESIRLNSKLHAGTYIRVPDIPRFSSRQQIQPQR